jgi:hypothetical protein
LGFETLVRRSSIVRIAVRRRFGKFSETKGFNSYTKRRPESLLF